MDLHQYQRNIFGLAFASEVLVFFTMTKPHESTSSTSLPTSNNLNMETTKPPPPSESSQKPKLVKKPKKVTKSKKSKSSQQRQLSPLTKMDKIDDPKRKLYNLYENFHSSDTKDAEAEIKIAEQNRIDVLRDMLMKTFGSKNLNPLNKSDTQTQGKNKTDSGKINEKGDAAKTISANNNVVKPKTKPAPKKGTKKSKTTKKTTVKKIEKS